MRRSLLAAGGFTAAAAVVWAAAFHTMAGARADATVLERFLELNTAGAHPLAMKVAGLADPVPVSVFTVAIVGVALLRRGVGLALAASIAVVGANVSTQALKVWTAEPRPVDSPAGAHVAAQSWPSGHATAAAALALCLVVVAPSRLRLPAAIVAGAFALGVACSVLVLGWHLPSDAMGGFCVAAAWTLAAVALAGAAAPQTEGEAESPAAWRPGSGGRNGRDEPSGRIGAGVQGDAARPREPES